MVSNATEREAVGVYLTVKQKKAIAQLAEIANTYDSNLYGMAIDDLLMKVIDDFEEKDRQLPLIEREWLKKRARQENLKVRFLEDKSKENKTGYSFSLSTKHRQLLDELAKSSNQSISYFIRVALNDFLSSLDIIEFVKIEKIEKDDQEANHEDEDKEDEKPSFNKGKRIPGPVSKDTRPRVSADELDNNKNK